MGIDLIYISMFVVVYISEFSYYSGGTDWSHPLPVPNQNCTRKKRTGIVPSQRSESEILSSPYLRALLLSELTKATTNFHSDCLLGEGGFGYVYKGWLCKNTLTAAAPGSGLGVAVKKLKPRGLQGHKEWLVRSFIFFLLIINFLLCVDGFLNSYVVRSELSWTTSSSKLGQAHWILLGR